MSIQPQLIQMHLVPKDVVYTPDLVARQIINLLNPSGKVLDPCKGKGAFYNNFPDHCERYWCEIDEGKDFFQWNEKVDWIIGNPPYSLAAFRQFLNHSFHLADNVAFLVPINKVFQSFTEMDAILKYGGIRSIMCYGPGRQINLPFGFAVGSFHFQRGYKGKCELHFMNPLARIGLSLNS